jgi:hypothetical protein
MPTFQQIYDAVEIKTAQHGYDIYKVGQMVSSPHLKDMTAAIKKSSVLVALEAAKVSIDEIIQDAVRRDKALDAYEKVEERKVSELEQKKAAENQKIQEEIEKFLNEKRALMESNNKSVLQAKERLAQWKIQKQAEEQRIFDTVSYFVAENPITTQTHPGVMKQTKPSS